MTNIAICHCKLGAAKHSISNDSLNEPDAYDSLKGPDAAGAYDSLKRSSSNHPYGSLNEPDAYGSLKGPDAAGTYDSLKGFIFTTFNQTYKNKLEGKNVQLIFCSNSLLKLSVLYLLGTTQNPGYPYSIGITFIFFQQKKSPMATSSRYLAKVESLFGDIESLFGDIESINCNSF